MIRRYPNHVDQADEYGYVSGCPNQVDVSTFGNPLRRLYICGCRYDQWPVSLVKQPKLMVKTLSIYAPLSREQLTDVGRGECDCHTCAPPKPTTWRDRRRRFREWLGAKVTPDNWDDGYDSWGEW